MNKKNLELDKLFVNWQSQYGESENFVKDGIINEDLFQKASPRILFIAKEPNDPNQEGIDYREWWSKEVRFKFSDRIAEWAYGILNNFPKYDEIWLDQQGKDDNSKALEAIQSIAFMNVKKSGGSGQSDAKKINEHIEKYKKQIIDQISIINPEIIILGLSGTEARSELIFPGIEWFESGYKIRMAMYDTYKIIDFYHPSARSGVAAPYCLLKCIFDTDTFKAL